MLRENYYYKYFNRLKVHILLSTIELFYRQMLNDQLFNNIIEMGPENWDNREIALFQMYWFNFGRLSIINAYNFKTIIDDAKSNNELNEMEYNLLHKIFEDYTNLGFSSLLGRFLEYFLH